MQPDIIIINDFAYVNGGASKVAIKTALALKDKGYNVIYFSAVQPVDHEFYEKNIQIILTEQNEILNNPNKLSAGFQGLWNKRAKKIFSKLLDNFDPSTTILHFHSWTKALSPSIFYPAIKKKFKIAITVHDYFFFCPNGGFFDYRKGEICNFLPMSIECIKKNCDSRTFSNKIWRLFRQWIQNYFLRSAGNNLHFILPSNFTRSIIEKYLPENSNAYVIGNPNYIKKDVPVEVQKNEAFVYVGRFSIEKGVVLFAKAAQELGIKTLFIGDGYLREEILKIYPKAVITGWVSESELKNLLKLARVLVYPSLCYETQGLAVLEAKAMGIPAIVSDCCAAREYIDDGSDGLLFRSGYLNSLIDKIKICKDDSIVKKMSERCFENYWKNPFTIDKYIELLDKCYQSIIATQ